MGAEINEKKKLSREQQNRSLGNKNPSSYRK